MMNFMVIQAMEPLSKRSQDFKDDFDDFIHLLLRLNLEALNALLT